MSLLFQANLAPIFSASNTWKVLHLTEPSTKGAVNSLKLTEAGGTFVYFIGRVDVDQDKDEVKGIVLITSKSQLYPINS